jgi:hypothetical protein
MNTIITSALQQRKLAKEHAKGGKNGNGIQQFGCR